MTSIGNRALLKYLKESDRRWNDDLFWAIRNRLIDDGGKLERGRGKGGSVRRAPTSDDQELPEKTIIERLPAERDLYDAMARVIKTDWSSDKGLNNPLVEVTAQQGARQTGGKWTRPDITFASYRTFPHVPGKHFDLITFEVKPC